MADLPFDDGCNSRVEGSGGGVKSAAWARTERLRSYQRSGPVSVVDVDGNETRLPQDRSREVLVAAVLAGLLVWIAPRRTRASA